MFSLLPPKKVLPVVECFLHLEYFLCPQNYIFLLYLQFPFHLGLYHLLIQFLNVIIIFDKIFDKRSPSSSFGGLGISLSRSAIFRCKLSCFLLSSRVFSAVNSPNGVVIVAVFVFRKLKLFCAGGGVSWNCLMLYPRCKWLRRFNTWR